MKVLSLFDGISCGRLALERADFSVEKYDAFEIDKYAISVSANNFPDIIQHGDVFNGDFTQFKGYDLLLGGSPCTYWSVAKKGRETTADGKGFRLFLQYVRALEESNCKYFVYENNHSIHKNIKNAISEKFGVKPIMINSALVSAQQRKRCYWTNIPNVTQPDDKNILLKDILESGLSWQEKSYCMTASYDGAIFKNTLERKQRTMVAVPIRIGEYGKGGQGQRIYSVQGKSVTLSANGGGQGAKTGLYKIDLPDGDYIIRKLTPVEAERLQTLPDNYTAGISNTQRYKCIGNAWTVDVISHILGGIKDVE
ncbi:MAG: DNA cytosine methyltransferase [Lachnospiraceae bacterium]|nr:DNA cytosine methyltransferase [Lachnospiraceae bacterium]MCM1231508.1 DNA cytosine methyltransferase [Ruminococcus flavefaciens]